MITASVTIVIETITARSDGAQQSLADKLRNTMNALDCQSYPRESVEHVIVLDNGLGAADFDELYERYRSAKFISSLSSNYFAAKNAGAAAASGDIIALIDSDCVPAPDWLETLVSAFEPNIAVVGGCSRYAGKSWAARTFSTPDFSYVLAENNGAASGINIHNVAFRREVLLSHPFDTRIPRHGGCYLLFHQLRAAGEIIINEPRAVIAHDLDVRGLGFVRKHFDRGYDGTIVYTLDDGAVLQGTGWFRQFGPAALVPIAGRRILRDCVRLLRHRRQIGIGMIGLPYFWGVAIGIRAIELAGGLAATVELRLARWKP